jgi:hypothetical protein
MRRMAQPQTVPDRMPPMHVLQRIVLVLLVVAAVVQVTVAVLR